MVDTGTIPAAGKLRDRIPARPRSTITRLPGVGPKRAREMFDQLGIDSLDALREAAETPAARRKGFGAEVRGDACCAALDAGGRRAGRRSVVLLDARSRSASRSPTALRAHPAAGARRDRGLRAPAGGLASRTWTSSPPRRTRPRWPPRWPTLDVDRVRGAAGRERRRAAARTTACASTCGSSSPTSSATCCSTSPARRAQRRAARGGGAPRGARLRVRDPRRRDRRDAALRDRGGGLRAARPAVDPARAARGPRRAARRPRDGGCRGS